MSAPLLLRDTYDEGEGGSDTLAIIIKREPDPGVLRDLQVTTATAMAQAQAKFEALSASHHSLMVELGDTRTRLALCEDQVMRHMEAEGGLSNNPRVVKALRMAVQHLVTHVSALDLELQSARVHIATLQTAAHQEFHGESAYTVYPEEQVWFEQDLRNDGGGGQLMERINRTMARFCLAHAD